MHPSTNRKKKRKGNRDHIKMMNECRAIHKHVKQGQELAKSSKGQVRGYDLSVAHSCPGRSRHAGTSLQGVRALI